jgi:hypothetical protein
MPATSAAKVSATPVNGEDVPPVTGRISGGSGVGVSAGTTGSGVGSGVGVSIGSTTGVGVGGTGVGVGGTGVGVGGSGVGVSIGSTTGVGVGVGGSGVGVGVSSSVGVGVGSSVGVGVGSGSGSGVGVSAGRGAATETAGTPIRQKASAKMKSNRRYFDTSDRYMVFLLDTRCHRLVSSLRHVDESKDSTLEDGKAKLTNN